jgi:hypothetical protein
MNPATSRIAPDYPNTALFQAVRKSSFSKKAFVLLKLARMREKGNPALSFRKCEKMLPCIK